MMMEIFGITFNKNFKINLKLHANKRKVINISITF